MLTSKAYLLFLLGLFLFSESSSNQICSQSQNITFDLSKIREQSVYDETSQKYFVDWMTGVEPSGFGLCLESVVLHYHGGADKECCLGFKSDHKHPMESGDIEPFQISICGTNSQAYLKFVQEDMKKSFAFQLNGVPECKTSEVPTWVLPFGFTGIIIMIFTILSLATWIFVKDICGPQNEDSGISEDKQNPQYSEV
jgi:hypothetical protein